MSDTVFYHTISRSGVGHKNLDYSNDTIHPSADTIKMLMTQWIGHILDGQEPDPNKDSGERLDLNKFAKKEYKFK